MLGSMLRGGAWSDTRVDGGGEMSRERRGGRRAERKGRRRGHSKTDVLTDFLAASRRRGKRRQRHCGQLHQCSVVPALCARLRAACVEALGPAGSIHRRSCLALPSPHALSASREHMMMAATARRHEAVCFLHRWPSLAALVARPNANCSLPSGNSTTSLVQPSLAWPKLLPWSRLSSSRVPPQTR